MGKPADGRGNTGSTDGIKAGGDAGNERHTCKANPATTDGIGKKHGTEDTSEDFSGERCALAPKAATNSLRRVDAMWLWARPDVGRRMVAGITAAFTSTYFVGGMGHQWR